MKILLINPPYNIENYYGSLSELAFVFPPVGLTYLAGYVRKLGHSVAIYDYQVEQRDFANYLDDFRPDVIGITCQTALFYNTIKLAEYIKSKYPQVPIVVGGAHATYRPADFFSSWAIDVVVRGEGEITLQELIDCYSQKQDVSDVEGISYRHGQEIIHSKNRPLIKNLDILPMPAIDLLPLDRYRVSPDNYLGGKVGLISTSRGCPFGCIFCACKEAFNRTYRSRNLDNVFDEIKYYIDNYDISELFIMDDCFGLERNRAMRFCDMMIERGYNKKLKWWCQIRVDLVDVDLFRKMKQAGCIIVSFGIESGVQRILNFISKKVSIDQIKKAVKAARLAGLDPRGSFIIGLPTETKMDSIRTILFSLRLPLSQAKFGLATPYPGTKLWDIALAEGQVKDEGEDWDRFTQMAAYTKYKPPYIAQGRRYFELLMFQKVANIVFYLKPTVVWSYVKRVKSPRDLVYFTGAFFKVVFGSMFKRAKKV